MAMQRSDELSERQHCFSRNLKTYRPGSYTNNHRYLQWGRKPDRISCNRLGRSWYRGQPTCLWKYAGTHIASASNQRMEIRRKITGGWAYRQTAWRLGSLPQWNDWCKHFSNRFWRQKICEHGILSKGHLSLSSSVSLSDESIKTLERFAAAFDNTYTRFLDLEKAEAQAREAQVETALEKVRSRTLAMQHSDELAETSSELFRQMIGLGIEPNRLYITIIHKEKMRQTSG